MPCVCLFHHTGKFGAGRGSRIPTPLKATVSKTVLSHQFHHSGILKVAHASCTCSQQPLPFSNERRSQFWTYGKANPFSHDLMLTYVERLRIIEIRPKVWKTFVLPLYYSRMFGRAYHSPVQEGGEQLSCGPSRYNATKKKQTKAFQRF